MSRKRRTIWIILLAILLLFVIELLFRPSAFRSSLGSLLFDKERFESAAKLFQKNADDPQAAHNLGKSRYKQGDYLQAMDDFERVLKEGGDIADAFYDKGNAAFQNKDYQEAIKNYEEALIRNPKDEDARANLELALDMLANNPPPPPQPDEDKRDDEDARNLLEALDNLEARERQNQKRQGTPRTDNWW